MKNPATKTAIPRCTGVTQKGARCQCDATHQSGSGPMCKKHFDQRISDRAKTAALALAERMK